MPDHVEAHRPSAVKFSKARQNTHSDAMLGMTNKLSSQDLEVQVMERHAASAVQFVEPRSSEIQVQQSWAVAPTTSSLSLKHNPDATRYAAKRSDKFVQAGAAVNSNSQAFEGVALSKKHNPHAVKFTDSRSSLAVGTQVSSAAGEVLANVKQLQTSKQAHQKQVHTRPTQASYAQKSQVDAVGSTGAIVMSDKLVVQAEGRVGHAADPEAAGYTNQVPEVFVPIQNTSLEAPSSSLQREPASVPSAAWLGQDASATGEDRQPVQAFRTSVRTVGSTNTSAETFNAARRISAATPLPVEESGNAGFDVQPRASTPKPRAHTPTWRAVKQSTGRARNNNM
jgi:hypothetical protein